jgi:hypothetical protein
MIVKEKARGVPEFIGAKANGNCGRDFGTFNKPRPESSTVFPEWKGLGKNS